MTTTELQSKAEVPSLDQAKRLVVKIGSALLVEQESGRGHQDWLDALADGLAALKARGVEIIVVSS